MNQEESKVLIKYSAPSKFCSEPYGQIWKQINDDNLSTLYIQISKKEDEPKWLKMGDFLELALAERLQDESFIKECLEIINQ